MKLKINALPCVSDEERTAYRAAFPDVPEPQGSGQLAVVGGGPSIKEHLQDLRGWPGDIWAINYTAEWLRAHGIDCYCYTVDPGRLTPDPVVKGKAILADHCHPSRVKAADSVLKVTAPMPGPTSATASTLLCLRAGYDGATYFGCESGYGETTHTDRDEPPEDLVRVESGGEFFLTKLELILQAEQLSSVIRTFPDRFSERSGGFLRAMVKHGEYDVVEMSRSLWERAQK